MDVAIRLLSGADLPLLDRVVADVFDGLVDLRCAAAFLSDPRLYWVVTLCDGMVVGMASAIAHVHRDKPPQFWISELSVASSHPSGFEHFPAASQPHLKDH